MVTPTSTINLNGNLNLVSGGTGRTTVFAKRFPLPVISRNSSHGELEIGFCIIEMLDRV